MSLGFARIEGSPEDYRGVNLWGGVNTERSAVFGGKSYGILSVDGALYAWVSPGSGATGYTETRLHRSVDSGASWEQADWAFSAEDELVFPTFLQLGQGYTGPNDNYVYVYAIELQKAGSRLGIQKPGQIALLRTQRQEPMRRDNIAFYAGLTDTGEPQWTESIDQREPVFEDSNGVGWNASVSYNAALDRYFLITEHEKSFEGHFGLFEGAEPWGPWRTVEYGLFTKGGSVESTTFFYNIPTKWLGPDGLDFVLIFTGIGPNDSWNTVRGRFQLSSGG